MPDSDYSDFEDDQMSTDSNLEEKLEALKLSLNENPFQYETQLAYTQLLRHSDDLTALKTAREEAIQYFVMPNEWANDEKNMASRISEKVLFLSLYGKGREQNKCIQWTLFFLDFLLQDWKMYSQNSIVSSVVEIRKMYQELLDHHLYDFEADKLFMPIIEFENEILEEIEEEQEIISQLEIIDSLYITLLKIPHHKHENSFQSYRNWKKDQISPQNYDNFVWEVKNNFYDQTVQDYQTLMKFEKQYLDSQFDFKILKSYYNHLKFTKLSNEDEIISFFDRILQTQLLNPLVWDLYLSYLKQQQETLPLIKSVLERAVKSCTWVAHYWAAYLLYQEQELSISAFKKKYELAKLACQPSFQSDKESFISFLLYGCEAMKRYYSQKSDKKPLISFIKAEIQVLHEYFQEGDLNFRLEKFYAHVLSSEMNQIDLAREEYNQMIQKNPTSSELWNSFFQFEQKYSDYDTVHDLFELCFCDDENVEMIDYPENLLYLWLEYEKQNCNHLKISEVVERIEYLNEKVKQRRYLEKQEKGQLQQQQTTNKRKNNKVTPSKPNKKVKQEEKRINKTFDTKEELKKNKEMPEAKIKEPKHEEKESKKYKQRKTKDEKINEGTKDEKEKEKNKYHYTDPEKALKTVFLKNLLHSVKEEHLSSIFEKCGPIEEIRIVQYQEPVLNTFAYLEFKQETSVEEALKMDKFKLEIDGKSRPIFISRLKPKYINQEGDKNTIFIANLPVEITESELKDLFEKCGPIKELELKNEEKHIKQSKSPFCYIEYKDTTSAMAALNLNGKKLKCGNEERNIKVLVSRRSISVTSKLKQKQHGRALHIQPTSTTSQSSTSSDSKALPTVQKTNEDFRAMLFGKK